MPSVHFTCALMAIATDKTGLSRHSRLCLKQTGRAMNLNDFAFNAAVLMASSAANFRSMADQLQLMTLGNTSPRPASSDQGLERLLFLRLEQIALALPHGSAS